MRIWAAEALGNLRDRRAVHPLLNYIREPDALNPWMAIQALGKIGDNTATQPVLLFLEDPDIYNRAHAAKALGFLDHSQVVDPLIGVLQSDSDDWVRGQAVESLSRIQSEQAYAAVKAALQDPSTRVSSVAKRCLTRYKQPPDRKR